MARMYARLLLLVSTLWLATPLLAADFGIIQDTAERYARLQTRDLPGQVGITVGQLDVGRLPPCNIHEAYTPPGTRPSGRTHIGVRCLGPNIWSVLVPVQISVTGTYIVAARPLASGQVIGEDDLILQNGDLNSLPAGTIGSPAGAIGKTLRNALAAGQPLRANLLTQPQVIRQGQAVRVISRGSGFAVSSEGKAVHSAGDGQPVQVRMPSGQVVSGTARADGSMEILIKD